MSAARDTQPRDPPPMPDFEGIYDSELGYVWSCLRRLGVAERDLEDVAHDLFVIVHQRLPTYDPRRPLRPWLFGIAFRVTSEHRRRIKRQTLEDPAHERADGVDAQEVVERSEQRARIQAALDRIPLGRRAVLLLHDLEGATAKEIAEVIEIPLNTVYSRLRVARRELATALARRERRSR